jgi:predicted outer membrane protein
LHWAGEIAGPISVSCLRLNWNRLGFGCVPRYQINLSGIQLVRDSMKRLLILLACLVVGGPALAQSVGEKTGVNSALGISPSTPDFVKQVAISDLFEIESNKLGQQKGNAAQKTFAGQMVTDHTKTSTELKSRGARYKRNYGRGLTVLTRANWTSSKKRAAVILLRSSAPCR